VVRRRHWFAGKPVPGSDLPDIQWFTPEGREMSEEDWKSGFAKSLAIFLNGEGLQSRDDRGQPMRDGSFVLFFNAHHEPLEFKAPGGKWGKKWRVVCDSATGKFYTTPEAKAPVRVGGRKVRVEARSMQLLQRVNDDAS